MDLLELDEINRRDAVMANEAFTAALWESYPAMMKSAGARPLENRCIRRLRRKPRTMNEWNTSANQTEYDGPIRHFEAPNYIVRDPCVRCGVRGDIGCEHRP